MCPNQTQRVCNPDFQRLACSMEDAILCTQAVRYTDKTYYSEHSTAGARQIHTSAVEAEEAGCLHEIRKIKRNINSFTVSECLDHYSTQNVTLC